MDVLCHPSFLDVFLNYLWGTVCGIVVGDDKLNIMTRWRNHDELLDRFRFVVLTRGATDVKSIIRNNKILNRYENHFRVCKSPKDIDNISSTECRKLINAKEWDKLKAYMDEKVIAYLNIQAPQSHITSEKDIF